MNNFYHFPEFCEPFGPSAVDAASAVEVLPLDLNTRVYILYFQYLPSIFTFIVDQIQGLQFGREGVFAGCSENVYQNNWFIGKV